jgi:ribose-phosphate pyrophosphokinase
MIDYEIAVIYTRSGKRFGQKVIANLEDILREEGEPQDIMIPFTVEEFASSEIKPTIKKSVRCKEVYIIADCENKEDGRNVDTNLRELKQAISAAKQSSAERIYVFVPSHPYARQDVAHGREPITLRDIIVELEALGGALLREVFCLDIHNRTTAAIYRTATLNTLFSSKVVIPYLRSPELNLNLENLVVYGCDDIKRARYYAAGLDIKEVGIVYKERDYSTINKSRALGSVGPDVEGKDVLLIDDMLDTGGTMIDAIKLLKSKGARKIYVYITHPLFNIKHDKESGIDIDPIAEFDRLYAEGLIEKVIATDTAFNGRTDLTEKPWYKEISVAPICARVIYNVHNHEPISQFLE